MTPQCCLDLEAAGEAMGHTGETAGEVPSGWAKCKDPVPPRFCLAREAARETMGQTGGTAGEVPPGWPKFRRELSFPLLVN